MTKKSKAKKKSTKKAKDLKGLKKTDPEIPRIEKYNYSSNLKCELSQKEISESSDDLARNLDILEGLKAEKKNMMEQLKAKATACEAEVVRLKGRVRDKCEYQMIKCEETKNFTTGKVKVIRLDTQKVVSERKMRDDEAQMNLDLDDDNPSDGKGDA